MSNAITTYRPLHTDLAILLVRLIFGGLFIYHGYTKLMAYDQILPMFGDIIGIGSRLSFNLVIFAELGCGFLVAVGFLTRLAVIPILITMSVAYFIAHGKDPFQVKELVFFFLAMCVPVFIAGSGRFSLDGLIQKKSANRPPSR